MKWQKKKQAALLLTASAALAVAGCNQGGGAGQTGGSEPSGTPTFKVLFDFNVDAKGMSLTDNEYIDYLQEKTGVRVELESPGSAGYLDKLNILMASGDYPDAFMVSDNDKNKLMQFATDGLLTDIAPYLDKYPNLKNAMPKEAWLPVTQDGKIWAIPYNRHDGFHQVVYINKNWMETLGLEIPRTIDEFYQVMKAFTDQDPDRNGKNDTFGLLAINGMLYGGKMFKAAFDAETYKFRNGELLPPEITEEYKNYLIFMNKLIEEKILDPEWPTTVGTIYRQKISTGKYGLTNNYWHFASGAQLAPGTAEQFIAIEPPLRPDGTPTKFSYSSTNRHYIAIPKDTKQVEELLKFIDWALSPEGTRYHYLGIEGKHYTTNNGKYEKTANERANLHWAFSMVKHGQLNDEVKAYMQADYEDHVIDNLTLANELGQLDKIAASLPYYPELTAYNLPKIVEEYTAKAILGNEKVEDTWDDYVKKYRASGGDKAIKLWTEWYLKEGQNLQ
ncbi:extracellular solute-binding protein [Paenibacillus ginsengihumi]|uniref:extracellular solute-binding protein n=1 Tax=Paenibacillus ginsengihumi TaxID=431596 RepID=UPI00037E4DAB|nr:extracellular solute-binding protein [Paenibacillus ginsengihumi]